MLIGSVVAAAPPAREAGPAHPAISGLEARLEGDQVLVKFELAGVPTQEALERIRSGLGVTHRHRVELLSRRALPLWPARTLASLRIDASATYDTLTRQYHLERTLERTGTRQERETRVDRQIVDTLEEACAWMARFEDLPPLRIPGGANLDRLRVHIESSLGRRYLLYLIPSRLTVSADTTLSP